MRGGKAIHSIAALVTLLLGCGIGLAWPELFKDPPARFSTITGITGLYGVVFAIIELMRTKAVAYEAAASAKIAADRVRILYGVRERAECQSDIRVALENFDEAGFSSAASLLRIVEFYSSEFADEYVDEQSNVRARIALIQSYLSLPAKARSKSPTKAKKALMEISTHLSAQSSPRMELGDSQ